MTQLIILQPDEYGTIKMLLEDEDDHANEILRILEKARSRPQQPAVCPYWVKEPESQEYECSRPVAANRPPHKVLFPKASDEDAKGGWTYDFTFIDAISKRTEELDEFSAGMEEVQNVLVALDEYFSKQPQAANQPAAPVHLNPVVCGVHPSNRRCMDKCPLEDKCTESRAATIRNETLDAVKQYADTCIWIDDDCCPGKVNDKEESDCDGCSYVDYPNNADICEKIESLRSSTNPQEQHTTGVTYSPEHDAALVERTRNETLDALERDFKGRMVEDAIAEIRRFPESLRSNAGGKREHPK